MAAALLDLPARPALRRARRPDPRPLRRSLAGRAPAPWRLRRLRRREASIQARRRKAPTLPARRGARQKVEHEYERKGALCYLAAWDARRARIFDRCASKDGIEPFDALVEQFMSQHPYNRAQRVFLVCDNGSAHRGKRSIDRLQGTWPNLIVIHTPIHASWLNQAEIYFSVVQRKVVTPNDFADLDVLEQQLLAFGRRYEQIAAPFQWKFTRQDLHKLLAKTDTTQPAALAA